MVQGEGAGIFVFEELEHAKARGADILAEVAGFAMSSDASDIVMPSKQGAARAIEGALPMRGSTPRRSAISTPMAPARRPMTRPNVPRWQMCSAPMPTG
jgi:3-oxoacyl-(acyl-carrier-protein) synthase